MYTGTMSSNGQGTSVEATAADRTFGGGGFEVEDGIGLQGREPAGTEEDDDGGEHAEDEETEAAVPH